MSAIPRVAERGSPALRNLFCVAVGIAALAAGCAEEPALVRQERKVALATALQHELLSSVAAEKSAVLATTDEESHAFADESKRRSADVERRRAELQRLVDADGLPGEVEKMTALNAALAEMVAVDTRLLDLAVANTNLKAARLAAVESAAAVDILVDALAAAQAEESDPALLRELSAGAVAALRSQVLLAPHIASSSDEEMTRLEARMSEFDALVEKTLAGAAVRVGSAAQAHLARGAAAWADYRRWTAEVIALSRQNTNVISFDVSVHEKRRVTEDALATLAALLEELRGGPHPTR